MSNQDQKADFHHWQFLRLRSLSHGTGGSAMQMAWLNTYRAARGYIVAAVNHPGFGSLVLLSDISRARANRLTRNFG